MKCMNCLEEIKERQRFYQIKVASAVRVGTQLHLEQTKILNNFCSVKCMIDWLNANSGRTA